MDQIQEARQILRRLFRPATSIKRWFGRADWLDWSRGPITWLHEAWGAIHVVGVGVIASGEAAHLEIYLQKAAAPEFTDFVRKQLPRVPIEFVITNGFHLLDGNVSAGSDIAVDGSSGMIGAILTDDAGNNYALTCAHVLDVAVGGPVRPPGGSRIGSVSHKVDLIPTVLGNSGSSDPDEPNKVDCALALLDEGTAVTGSGKPMGNLPEGAEVHLGGPINAGATIRSTLADIGAVWVRRSGVEMVYFDDVVIADTEGSVIPGCSGSPVTVDGRPAGIVFAGPPIIKVGVGGMLQPVPDAKVAICDLRKAIEALKEKDPKPTGLRLL